MNQRSTTQPPALDDERIALLRSGVMGAVDDDVRRRARRARLVSAGAGLAAVVLVVGTGLQLAGSDSTDLGVSGARDLSVDSAERAEPGVAVPEAMSENAATAQGASGSAPADLSTQPVDADRSVITTGSATVTVDDPADAALELAEWTEDRGGRVDQRTDRDESSTLTVRVPAGEVTAALEKLRDLGEVESSSISKVDVTSEVVDLDARIEALQTSVDRLNQLITSAATTSEVIEAETQLTYRQAELQGLRAQRDSIGDEVDLSTLEVRLQADRAAPSVEPGGFLGGLEKGWNALVNAVNGVVEGLGVLVPWLGVTAVVLVLVGLVRRFRRRRS